MKKIYLYTDNSVNSLLKTIEENKTRNCSMLLNNFFVEKNYISIKIANSLYSFLFFDLSINEEKIIYIYDNIPNEYRCYLQAQIIGILETYSEDIKKIVME